MNTNVNLCEPKRIGTTLKMFGELKGLFPVFMKQPAWFIKGMILCELVTRFYVTIMIAIIGGFEADSHRSFIIYVSIALAIDVARNFFNKDLKISETIISAKTTEYMAKNDVLKEKTYKRAKKIYKWIVILYAFVCFVIYKAPLNIAQPIVDSDNFQKFYHLLSHISNAMRTIPQDLMAHHYPDDAYRIFLLLVVGNVISYLTYIQVVFGIPDWLYKSVIRNNPAFKNSDSITLVKAGFKGFILASFLYLSCG